jgi:hypothetical protein
MLVCTHPPTLTHTFSNACTHTHAKCPRAVTAHHRRPNCAARQVEAEAEVEHEGQPTADARTTAHTFGSGSLPERGQSRNRHGNLSRGPLAISALHLCESRSTVAQSRRVYTATWTPSRTYNCSYRRLHTRGCVTWVALACVPHARTHARTHARSVSDSRPHSSASTVGDIRSAQQAVHAVARGSLSAWRGLPVCARNRAGTCVRVPGGVCACKCARARVCMRARARLCMRARARLLLCVLLCVYSCMCACVRVRVAACVRACFCIAFVPTVPCRLRRRVSGLLRPT